MKIETGQQSFWANSMPRQEYPNFPHGAVDEEGKLKIEEIDATEFGRIFPQDGWLGSWEVAIPTLGIRFLNVAVGMKYAIGVWYGYEREHFITRFYRLGCPHKFVDEGSAPSIGHHKYVCQLCGLTEHLDSSG